MLGVPIRETVSVIYFSLIVHAIGYCWQPGRNPEVIGRPQINQLSLDELRISWNDQSIRNRECVDQFLVKYWPCTHFTHLYWMSSFVDPSADHVDITLKRRGCVTIQLIAREDKGIFGVDYNRGQAIEYYPQSHHY